MLAQVIAQTGRLTIDHGQAKKKVSHGVACSVGIEHPKTKKAISWSGKHARDWLVRSIHAEEPRTASSFQNMLSECSHQIVFKCSGRFRSTARRCHTGSQVRDISQGGTKPVGVDQTDQG